MSFFSALNIYILSRTISLAGDIVFNIFVATYVYKVSNSSLTVAIVMALSLIPRIILGKFVISKIDKFDCKNIMIYADFFRFIILLPIIFVPRYELFYIIVPLLSMGSLLFIPSSIKYIQEATNKEQIVSVNSKISFIENGVKIIVPALAGSAFFLSDFSIVFLLNAVSYLLSGLLLLLLKSGFSKTEIDIKQSDKASNHKNIKIDNFVKPVIFIIVSSTFALINGIGNAIFPVFMLGQAKLSEFHYSLMFTVAGVGLLIGSLIVPKMSKKMDVWSISKLSLVLASVLLLGYILFYKTLWILYLTRFLVSITMATFFISYRSSILLNINNQTIASFSTKNEIFDQSFMLVGIFVAGVFAEFVSPSILFFFSVVLGPTAVLFCRLLEKFNGKSYRTTNFETSKPPL